MIDLVQCVFCKKGKVGMESGIWTWISLIVWLVIGMAVYISFLKNSGMVCQNLGRVVGKRARCTAKRVLSLYIAGVILEWSCGVLTSCWVWILNGAVLIVTLILWAFYKKNDQTGKKGIRSENQNNNQSDGDSEEDCSHMKSRKYLLVSGKSFYV